LALQFRIARNLRDLQHGAGSGSFDVRAGAIAEWLRGRWSFVGATSFTRVGRPPFPDRRIEWRGGAVVSVDEPLILPHRLDVGVVVRRVLRSDLAAVAEATTVFDVGHRTRIVDRARPVDILAGLQLRRKRFRVTAALRDHRNALQSMKVQRHRPHRPDARDPDDLSRYVQEVGLSEAMPLLLTGTHRLLVPSP